MEIRRRNSQFQNPVWGQVVELLIRIRKEQHSKGGYVSSLLGTCATEDLCAIYGHSDAELLDLFLDCIWVCLKIGYFPNEIAI